MATPVFLPGESPWMEEPGGLSLRGHRIRQDNVKYLVQPFCHQEQRPPPYFGCVIRIG